MPVSYVERYWGKQMGARPQGAAFHPVAYHNLDVAACLQELLTQNPYLLERIAQISGGEGEPLGEARRESMTSVLVWLAAIHDAGKFLDSFQGQLPDLMMELQGRPPLVGATSRRVRHDQMSCRLWAKKLVVSASSRLRLDRKQLRCLQPWVSAVLSHHGAPPDIEQRELLKEHAPDAVLEDVVTWFEDTSTLFSPHLDGLPRSRQAAQESAWLVAGLAITADWLGSSGEWFPYHEASLSLQEYWRQVALPRARVAVERSGLKRPAPRSFQGHTGLFPGFTSLTPTQTLAASAPLPKSAQVWILEEATGGGKTEAAMLLAHRAMAQGLANGLYYALPTMATSNAMHARIRQIYARLYEEEDRPSLVLAHSARALALEMQKAQRGDCQTYGEEGDTASMDCQAWLSKGSKRALLADVGVGTIDQALLAVLPVRHQALRLVGLCGKLLIVDEVHACDAYVHRILCRLLHFHAAHGGSAILLSATLPQWQRRELLEAFAQGRQQLPPRPQEQSWPLVTCWSQEGLVETPTQIRPEVRRRVQVRLVQEPAAIDDIIGGALGRGQCVCYIRNTVQDARDAYERWSARLEPGALTLFHSRFALGDRLAIEARVLERFGKASTGEQRRGQLLIATQVVEQSLDLDFDLMVTDLAPADLLIQRAGRMRRHKRDLQGDLVPGQDERGEGTLVVLCPEPVEDAGASWYASMFPRAAFVYPDHGQLWRTAAWLDEHGAFAIPEGARAWVEFVYGEQAAEDIPEGLKAKSQAAAAKRNDERSHALFNALNYKSGYSYKKGCSGASGQWEREDRAPTRLGEPTSQVRLLKEETPGSCEPWWSQPPMRWMQSEVRIRAHHISAPDPSLSPEALEQLTQQMPDKGRYCVPVILRPQGGQWVGRATDERGRPVTVTYDPVQGLHTAQEER